MASTKDNGEGGGHPFRGELFGPPGEPVPEHETVEAVEPFLEWREIIRKHWDNIVLAITNFTKPAELEKFFLNLEKPDNFYHGNVPDVLSILADLRSIDSRLFDGDKDALYGGDKDGWLEAFNQWIIINKRGVREAAKYDEDLFRAAKMLHHSPKTGSPQKKRDLNLRDIVLTRTHTNMLFRMRALQCLRELELPLHNQECEISEEEWVEMEKLRELMGLDSVELAGAAREVGRIIPVSEEVWEEEKNRQITQVKKSFHAAIELMRNFVFCAH